MKFSKKVLQLYTSCGIINKQEYYICKSCIFILNRKGRRTREVLPVGAADERGRFI